MECWAPANTPAACGVSGELWPQKHPNCNTDVTERERERANDQEVIEISAYIEIAKMLNFARGDMRSNFLESNLIEVCAEEIIKLMKLLKC